MEPAGVERHRRASPRRLTSGEAAQLLRRAETAQRLQSRGRLRGRRVALDSGGIDFLSSFRRAGMDDEDIYHRRHLRISGGGDFFVGVRDYAGRNQT